MIRDLQQTAAEQLQAIAAPLDAAVVAALALKLSTAALIGIALTGRRKSSQGYDACHRVVGRFIIVAGLPAFADGGRHLRGDGVVTQEQRTEGGGTCRVLRAERHGYRGLRQAQAVIGKHHDMAIRPVLEVIVDAFFFTQSMQQCQVRLVVLDAERARRVVPHRQIEAEAVRGQAMFCQQAFENVRHAQSGEHPASGLLLQFLQVWHQHHLVTDPVGAAVFTTGAVKGTVQAMIFTQLQERRAMQQTGGSQGRSQTNDFNLESVGAVQRFVAAEAQYRQAQATVGECQREGTFLVIEHSHGLCRVIRATEGTKPQC